MPEQTLLIALIEEPELVQILRENCVLCGRYFFIGNMA